MVQQVINKVMLDGKKSVAEAIVYDALAIIGERSGKNPIEQLEAGIKALTPVLEVRSPRVGGAPPPGLGRGPPAAGPLRSRSVGGWAPPASDARRRWPSGSPTSCSTPSSSR